MCWLWILLAYIVGAVSVLIAGFIITAKLSQNKEFESEYE